MSVKGAKCLQLACGHVFCRSCLYDYWSFSIAEGSVEKLGCPDPECVKIGRESAEEEIARVVSEQEVRRWRWLKEKIMFERDPSLVHCPMVFCQSPVPRPLESETDVGGDRLRICPACSFSFCGFCKRTCEFTILILSVISSLF
jgi:E3 ubiquitin-protein ligase RNF14